MTDDEAVAGLLQEGIDAQNRTTHAVRAFVRFFFIQLVAVTIASPLLYFGTNLDALGLVLIALVVLVVGIVWSSYAGWTELGLSDRFTVAREEARALRQAQVEAERGKSEDEREARKKVQDAARGESREARRKLLATRKFRWGVIAISLAGIGGAAAILVPVLIAEEKVTSERAELLADLSLEFSAVLAGLGEDRSEHSENYVLALDSCSKTIGLEASLESQYSIIGTTLRVRNFPRSAESSGEGLVTCVLRYLQGPEVARLTSNGSSGSDVYKTRITTAGLSNGALVEPR
jgi:hypothetical protein